MKKSITSARGVTYYIDKILGKGQFSKVYYVTDENHDEFAMKAVNWEKLMMSEKMVQLFKNEQQIMEIVDHPRILKLYDKLIDGNTIYLITTYCDGGNLEDLVMKNYPQGMGEKMATNYLVQVAQGFQTMKKYSIIHRDLKPANIFIKKGEVVIGDFGFAKIGVSLTQTKLGTPYYMAPEILDESNKGDYSSNCDLWSIGVCYYFFIYGFMPFQGAKTSDELLSLARTFSGDNLRFEKEPSPDVKNLLSRLIEADPGKRMSFDEFFKHPLIGLEESSQSISKTMSVNTSQNTKVSNSNSFNSPNQSYNTSINSKGKPEQNSFSLSTANSYITDFDLSNSNLGQSHKNSTFSNLNESDIPNSLKGYLYNKNIIIFLMDTAKKLKICETQKNLEGLYLHFIVIELIVIRKAINYTQMMKNIMSSKSNVYKIPNFDVVCMSAAFMMLQSFFVEFERFIQQVYAKIKSDLSLHTKLAGQTIQRIETFENEELDREVRTSITHILKLYKANVQVLSHMEKLALMQAVIYLFFNIGISSKFPEAHFLETKQWIAFCQMLNGKSHQDIETKMFNYFEIA